MPAYPSGTVEQQVLLQQLELVQPPDLGMVLLQLQALVLQPVE